jgi:hypothetical protein
MGRTLDILGCANWETIVFMCLIITMKRSQRIRDSNLAGREGYGPQEFWGGFNGCAETGRPNC